MSVGVLAMLVNIAVLVMVTVLDRAIALIVRNFARSRLHTCNRAPVVHDSDTWLPNIPRSIIKYRRHPAILTTVLCTVFLIASELITELGVGVSENCSPKQARGLVISAGDSSRNSTVVELGAISFFVHTVAFVDGNLTQVSSGMPKKLTGKECLPCLYKRKLPIIANKCSIELEKVHKPNELLVGVEATKTALGVICVGFNETAGSGMRFSGQGDLTGNGMNRAIFLFAQRTSEGPTDEFLYFEYASQPHAERLKRAAREEGKALWQKNEAPVYMWSIKCGTNRLSPGNFREALTIYRTIQLENPAQLARFDERKQKFQEITHDDIYRAILSLKIIDDDREEGVYDVYTSCAVYNWAFLLPIGLCLTVILVLGLLSSPKISKVGSDFVPYNSRSWFHYFQKKNSRDESSRIQVPGYFDGIHEQMVLVDVDGGKRLQLEGSPKSHEDELPV